LDRRRELAPISRLVRQINGAAIIHLPDTTGPSNSSCALNHDVGYLRQGRGAEAQRGFDQFLKIDPT